MTTLTSRERLHRCYTHQELDRPGVYIRTFWPSDASYEPVKAWVNEHTDRKIPIDLHRLEKPHKITVTRQPYSDDFAKEITTLHTPEGDLQSVMLEGLRLLPGYCQEHFIKTPEDAKKWLSLPLPEFCGDGSFFHEANRQIGDRGIADAILGGNPGGTVASLMGSETFAYFTVSDRDIVHAMCQRQQEILLRRLRHALSLGIGPYFSFLGQEWIVPPLHGPEDFKDFNARYDKAIIDAVHEACGGGGRIHVHCHSKIGQVFQQFVDLGVDVLHPFEPPPMGDITAKEAKRLARGKMCLEGNIQIAHMYEHTPEQIYEEARQLIADTFDDHRDLIVSPTASCYQVGKGAECFEQIKAMVAAATRSEPRA
ncbi:MAG: hypothetical protein FWD61_13765 [Phycisphaerales bacterium]|nr:hypothetical protein [Phycisphaerales bacterium]